MDTNKNYVCTNESLFSYKDGFCEFPYLSNSPDLMLDSVINFPGAKHIESQQKVITQNELYNSDLNYLEIEAGIWILLYNFDIKHNIIANAIYDIHKESDFFYLTMSVFDYDFPIKSIEKSIILKSKCWTLYKPKTKVSSCFYENTSGNLIIIAFSKKWAQEHISKTFPELNTFFNSNRGFLTWIDQVPFEDALFEKICIGMNQFPVRTDIMKADIMELQLVFFSTVVKDNRLQNFSALNIFDNTCAAKAESIILHNLNLPFIGIKKIADALNVSPTKLKIIFKVVFGLTILQYHKEKNMLLAYQLLENSHLKISNIAQMTGYESAGKFSSAFKKRFGCLPSIYRNNCNVS